MTEIVASHRVDRGCLVVQVAGEVDLANAHSLQDYLLDLVVQGTAHVVVDLSHVGYMDSTGLAALVTAWRRTHELGGSLRVAGAVGSVRKVLEITQLDVAFDRHVDVAEAVSTAVAARDGA